jgi:hypothetical protein
VEEAKRSFEMPTANDDWLETHIAHRAIYSSGWESSQSDEPFEIDEIFCFVYIYFNRLFQSRAIHLPLCH